MASPEVEGPWDYGLEDNTLTLQEQPIQASTATSTTSTTPTDAYAQTAATTATTVMSVQVVHHPAHHQHHHPLGLKRSIEDVVAEATIAIEGPPTSKRSKNNKNSPATLAASTNKQWDAMFQRLVAYKALHGDCLVPKRYPQDPKLGTWVETQRVQHKRLVRQVDAATGVESVQPNKRLNAERLSKLQDIGFAWTAKNVRKTKQPPGGATAAAAAARSVDNSTSTTMTTPGSQMAADSHAMFSVGDKFSSPLNKPAAVRAPNTTAAAIAPAASVLTSTAGTRTGGGGGRLNEYQWEEMYQRLVKYREKHDDCLVPRKYEEDPKLATWVETQRVLWNRDYRVETAGVFSSSSTYSGGGSGTSTPTAPFPEMGCASIPTNENTNITASASAAMATNVPQAPLPADADMNSLKQPPPSAATAADPPATTTFVEGELYEQSLSRASSGISENTTDLTTDPTTFEPDPGGGVGAPAPTHAADHIGEPLSTLSPGVGTNDGAPAVAIGTDTWLAPQPAKNEALMASIAGKGGGSDGMDVSQPDAKMASVQQQPQTRPPPQQQQIPTKRLTQERKDKLDAIGFVWSLRSKRVEDHWDHMFQQLVEYKAIHGDCLVPSRYEQNLKLGKWVETQRYEHTKLQRAATGAAAGSASGAASGNASGADVAMLEGKQEGESALVPLAPVAAAMPGVKPRANNPRLTEERLRRLESIGFEWKVRNKMKRYYDKQWQDMFERLLKFKAENNHCMVPKRYPPDIKLGTWVHTQRIQYRKLMAGSTRRDSFDATATEMVADVNLPKGEEASFRLTEDRRKRLEEAGFVWSAREGDPKTDQSRMTRNSYDDLWDAMFARLVAYKNKYGDCLVPKRYKEEPKLGTWVDTQRVQYKKMKKKLADKGAVSDGSPAEANAQVLDAPTVAAASASRPIVGRLTDDRIRRLEELGFVWSLRDDWTKHYEELKQYKLQTGHCNVPARYSQNRRLGIWVSAQRQQYKLMQVPEDPSKPRRSAPLTQERISLLNELGFTWTIRSRDSVGEFWNQRLQDLKEYKAKHGNCLVPSRYPPNPELGVWVGTQRTQYRLYLKAKETGEALVGCGSMNDERIQQLEELGFRWTLKEGGGSGKDSNPLLPSTDSKMLQAADAILQAHNASIGSASAGMTNHASMAERATSMTTATMQEQNDGPAVASMPGNEQQDDDSLHAATGESTEV